MKTRTFVVEILWLLVEMCLCPQCDEQTTEHPQAVSHQTTPTDSSSNLERWYCPNYVRPPPRGNPDKHDLA